MKTILRFSVTIGVAIPLWKLCAGDEPVNPDRLEHPSQASHHAWNWPDRQNPEGGRTLLLRAGAAIAGLAVARAFD